MRIKMLILSLFTLLALPVYGQTAQIKGRVIDRDTRGALDGISVQVIGVDKKMIQTNKDGEFVFPALTQGRYNVVIEGLDWEKVEFTVDVRKDGVVRNVGNISLVSTEIDRGIDIFDDTEYDTGSEDQTISTSLSASRDIFDQVAGYNFSAMRFRSRGYDQSTQQVYINGVYMNDAQTGYTPWSLLSGLNDATRDRESTSGAELSDHGVGGINGTSNINARASRVRKGFRFSVVHASGQYLFRGMATYGSGILDNGWSYALSVSSRQGGNFWVDGVYYDSWGYFGSVEKKFKSGHSLGLTFMGTPGERGVQAASTQEAYDLAGSNYYNANWGYQGGDSKSDMRNARVREMHEPIAMLMYNYEPNSKFKLSATASLRFGKNGYSALNWQNTADPRPDYYRNLPSYHISREEYTKAIQLTRAWKTDVNTRQINWNELYYANEQTFNGKGDENVSFWGGTNPSGKKRSRYMIEDRRTDQLDFNANVSASYIFNNMHKIRGGVRARINRTEYFKTVKDLLGGDYYFDIDHFIQRDYPEAGNQMIQSNVNTPNRLVQKGDKFGYDYYGHVQDYRAWANYYLTLPIGLEATLGAEVGNNKIWREGLYQKGAFMDNSYGESEKKNFLVYTAKLGLKYRIGVHSVYANVTAMQNAPYFRHAFKSARTRNDFVNDIKAEKVFSADLNYSINMPAVKLRLTGYYTTVKDRVNTMTFYNNVQAMEGSGNSGFFTNFAVTGIDQRYVGVELAASIPIIAGISVEAALSYGNYEYTDNAKISEYQDVSDLPAVLDGQEVLWDGYKVEWTPQTAATLGLSYKGPYNIFAGLNVSYYDGLTIAMAPSLRAEQVKKYYGVYADDIMKQKTYGNYFVLNANFGKYWYLKGGYMLGVNLDMKNLLNNTDIVTGGYEQARIMRSGTNNAYSYDKFGEKLYYMMGFTYYLNVYLRF